MKLCLVFLIDEYAVNESEDFMVYGYIRVSSDKQTVENQRFEIQRFCLRENLHINGWIEETISGMTNYTQRELGSLLRRVQKDDLIICAELSRLGRTLFIIMEILHLCMEKGCSVWTIKDNYRLGDDVQSKVLAFAFGISAEIERNLISQRTKEALARKKAGGVALGRRPGEHNHALNSICVANHDFILRQLHANTPIVRIAQHLHINRNTLYRYLERTAIRQSSTE